MNSAKYSEVIGVRLTSPVYKSLRLLAQFNRRKISDMARLIIEQHIEDKTHIKETQYGR